MGIRFLCQHCQKPLNVKATQAGRRGKCPFCKKNVSVPARSSDEGAQPKKKVRAPKADSFLMPHKEDEQETAEGEKAGSAAQAAAVVTRTKAKPKAKAKSTNSGSGANPKSEAVRIRKAPAPAIPTSNGNGKKQKQNSASDSFMLDRPTPPPTMGKVDPIAEAPKRIWYFRSKDLGEKGPLKGKAMRDHLDNGDVTVGCIVWREDWEDWVPAEQVFPELVEEAKRSKQRERINRAFKDANYEIPDELNPHSEYFRRMRKRKMIFTTAIICGIVIVVVLAVILIQLVSS